jgi:outer membrane protein
MRNEFQSLSEPLSPLGERGRGEGQRALQISNPNVGRTFVFSLFLLTSSLSLAQTTPIQVKTPDVVVPPAVSLPGFGTALAPLSMEEAVRIALRQQPTIEDARGQLDQAGGRARQTASGLGPSVGLTGSLTRTDRLAGSSSSGGGTSGTGGVVSNGNLFSSGRVALAAAQLLFDFGRTRDQVRQDKALQGAAVENLTKVQMDVALDVRQRFADLVQAQHLVTVAEANVTNRQAQLNLAEANLASGLYPPKDVVDAKTNLAAGVASLITARGNEASAKILLAQAMGVDPRTPLTPKEETSPVSVPADPTELFTTALASRPELRQAKKTLEAAGFGISAAQKSNALSLSATATIGSSGGNDPFQSQTSAVGLTLDWPFFNSGATAGAVQQAKGVRRSAEANYKQAQQAAIADVGQAYLDLANSVQRVAVAEVGVANATEGVRLAEGRYRGGVGGTFLDVTTAQAQLFTAQQTLETARGDVVRAKAALDRAIGKPV